MKTASTILVFLLLIGCNSSEKKDKIETPVKTAKPSAKTEKKAEIDLPQNSNYTALFNNEECSSIITAAQIEKATGMSVTPKMDKQFCRYELPIAGKKPTSYMIDQFAMSKNQVQKEIESYIKNKPFLHAQVSETGDSYVCMQASHGRVIIYNSNYENGIIVSYGSRPTRSMFTKEEQETQNQVALTIANAILKNNQK